MKSIQIKAGLFNLTFLKRDTQHSTHTVRSKHKRNVVVHTLRLKLSLLSNFINLYVEFPDAATDSEQNLSGSQVVNESIKFIFYLEDVISFVVVTLGETNFNTKSARKQPSYYLVCLLQEVTAIFCVGG